MEVRNMLKKKNLVEPENQMFFPQRRGCIRLWHKQDGCVCGIKYRCDEIMTGKQWRAWGNFHIQLGKADVFYDLFLFWFGLVAGP